jgi:hypothetical protein
MFFQAKYYNTKTTFTKLLRKYIITRGLFIYIYIYIIYCSKPIIESNFDIEIMIEMFQQIGFNDILRLGF